MNASRTPSAMLAGFVYQDGVRDDDPAETYHEASRLSAAAAFAQLPGLQLLEDEPVLQASIGRASRRHPHRRGIDLCDPSPLRMPIGDTLERRRSGLDEAPQPLQHRELAALLDAGYGVRRNDQGARRPLPSGGALYPLELYAAVTSVAGVPPGVYHYDPFARRIADLERRVDAFAAALVDPSLLERTTAAIVITAVFWRSRFKYGQRAYRFALLEAGHLAQNLLLAAASLGLSALPLGGFYDRAVDEAIGVDGVDEAALYIVLVGGRS